MLTPRTLRAAAIGGLAAGARGFERAGFKASQAKAAARVRALCGTMCLPLGVQADALGLSEHLLAKLYGRGALRIGNYEKACPPSTCLPSPKVRCGASKRAGTAHKGPCPACMWPAQ